MMELDSSSFASTTGLCCFCPSEVTAKGDTVGTALLPPHSPQHLLALGTWFSWFSLENPVTTATPQHSLAHGDVLCTPPELTYKESQDFCGVPQNLWWFGVCFIHCEWLLEFFHLSVLSQYPKEIRLLGQRFVCH